MKALKALATLIAFSMAGPAAAEGDRDYGEYLSGECVTCHRLDGEMEGIPAIIGWDDDLFIEAMNQYRTGERKNDAMRSVVIPLGKEEIAALATFFRSLGE